VAKGIDLSSLNPSQLEAVLYNEGNLLVSAGAGSGKTRVIAYKVAYLVSDLYVPHQNILAVTFTNKAAGEMKERVEKLLNLDFFSGQISTFHSFCLKVLRREAHYIGYSGDFSVCDSYDSIQVVKDVLSTLKIKLKLKPRAVHSAISGYKNGKVADLPDELNKGNIEFIVNTYNNYLKNNNLMDFDDLLINCVKLFEAREDILSFYSNQFPFILIDEFQDTNSIQYRLVKLLSANSIHLCVVGDEDQSIYGFRGAEYRNISSFLNDFAPVKVVKLEKNYRSTKPVLEVANSVISNNTNRIKKSLYSEKDFSGEMVIFGAARPDDEAEFVASNVGRLIESGEPPGDIAVLYRANYLSRHLEDSLMKWGIPYVVVGGIRFYERKEIKDILAYLRLINNPHDNVSFKRVINLPKRGIGEKTLEKLLQFSPYFYESIDLIPENFPKYRQFRSFKESIERLKRVHFNKGFFDTLLKETGYLDILKTEYLGYELESRTENIYEFRNIIKEYLDRRENPSLSDFLDSVALVSDTDTISGDAVNLMTVHSAKGLEFNTIFVVGLEEGVFPTAKSLSDTSKVEEERRLFYVAITRAKTNLFLSFSRTRGFGNSSFSRNVPSRFFREFPVDFFDCKGDFSKEEVDFTRSSYAPDTGISDEAKEISLTRGDTVAHNRYGEGEVMNVLDGGARVIVKFKRVGIKILRSNSLSILEA